MAKSKYCYAIINVKTDTLITEDGKLPIYWNKKVAKQRVKKFKDCYLEAVLIEELTKHILTYPK
jgi:hypothetical protein